MKKYFIIILILLFSCKKENVEDQFCDCAETETDYIIDTMFIKIPNIFTPNGDGINDIWYIENIDHFSSVSVKVKDLRNKIIFKSSNYGEGNEFWFGKNFNNPSSPVNSDGKYYYEIVISNVKITGYVCIYTKLKEYKNIDCLINTKPFYHIESPWL